MLLVAATVLALGCHAPATASPADAVPVAAVRSEDPPSVPPVTAATPMDREPSPTVAKPVETLVDLPVPGFHPAVLHLPSGAGQKAVVVGAHGAWDRADAFCDLLVALVRGRAFVLCPRGKRTDARASHESASYFFQTHLVLEAEVLAAMGALEAAYPDRVDPTRAVYAGFSQGAIMGAAVLVRNPGRFPRALLIEGAYGYGLWTADMGARYRRQGGERVLFVCGGWYCADQARTSAGTIEGRGARTRVVKGSGGHTYGGDVARAAREAFPWLIEGDARFLGP